MFRLLRAVMFNIYFYITGLFDILDDIIHRRYNKCELKSRIGEVAVITGGARGIGAQVVKQLLLCDMHVVIGCRDEKAGVKLMKALKEKGVTSGSSSVLQLDLASLHSVRAFAKAVLDAHPKIHLLINNAGIFLPPYSETVDGFESRWAVNYLGHFLLSHLLLPRLHETAGVDGSARIVNVSSCVHRLAYPIDFDNINMKDNFIVLAAYAQSKLAQVMFSLYLDRKLRDAPSGVRIVVVHPGVVDTDIFDGSLLKAVIPCIMRLYKTPEEGATTVMYAALHANGGEYISNGQTDSVSKMAQDKKTQAELFDFSKRSLGISLFGGLLI